MNAMMNSLKNLSVINALIILSVVLMNCSNNSGRIKTNIKGSFPAFGGKSIILSEFDINSTTPVDTSVINDDGSFGFRFYRSGPGFYLIKIDNKNYITLALDQEKNVEIQSDSKSLRKDYHVMGSEDSEAFREFEMTLESNRSKIDSLRRLYSDKQRSATFHSVKSNLDQRYSDIFENQRQSSIDFIKNNCQSLVSLLVINKRFGERKILTAESDLNSYLMLDSCLSIKYKENKFVQELNKQIKSFLEERKIEEMAERRLSPGNKIPDISLEDLSGKIIPISSFSGKPVLLYFWASWDKSSRLVNQKLKEILKREGKGKFVVYAIGFENSKKAWEDAIRADGLQSWTHVTDYLNIHSSAKSLYNVPDELPFFFVLNKDLVIMYKGSDIEELKAIVDLVVE